MPAFLLVVPLVHTLRAGDIGQHHGEAVDHTTGPDESLVHRPGDADVALEGSDATIERRVEVAVIHPDTSVICQFEHGSSEELRNLVESHVRRLAVNCETLVGIGVIERGRRRLAVRIEHIRVPRRDVVVDLPAVTPLDVDIEFVEPIATDVIRRSRRESRWGVVESDRDRLTVDLSLEFVVAIELIDEEIR
ncbi:hypothetical protein ACFQH8_18255 [Halomicroarcula sp. GCM10025710]